MSTENKPIVPEPAPIHSARLAVGGLLLAHEFHHLRSHWRWFLLLGLLLVACGTVSVVFPILASVWVVDVLAAIFLIGGFATIITAFWTGRWSGMLVQVLFGLLYIAAGFVMTDRPLMTVVMITIFLAVAFIVAGIFRMLAALTIRFPQWGWALLNGAVTTLLGVIIYRHISRDSEKALWVIGLLVGLEMLFAGWTWIMLALAIRDIPEKPTA